MSGLLKEKLGLGFTNRVDSKSRKFDVGRAENVPVIDVCAAFRDRQTMFDAESHLRVEGHRVAAQLIYEALEGFSGGERVPLRT